MRVDDYIVWLNSEFREAIRAATTDTVRAVEVSVRNRIPSDRIKTRRAVVSYVRAKPKGYRGTVRLRFQKKYRMNNTKTEQLFRAAWRRTRPIVQPTFERRLSTYIKGV